MKIILRSQILNAKRILSESKIHFFLTISTIYKWYSGGVKPIKAKLSRKITNCIIGFVAIFIEDKSNQRDFALVVI